MLFGALIFFAFWAVVAFAIWRSSARRDARLWGAGCVGLTLAALLCAGMAWADHSQSAHWDVAHPVDGHKHTAQERLAESKGTAGESEGQQAAEVIGAAGDFLAAAGAIPLWHLFWLGVFFWGAILAWRGRLADLLRELGRGALHAFGGRRNGELAEIKASVNALIDELRRGEAKRDKREEKQDERFERLMGEMGGKIDSNNKRVHERLDEVEERLNEALGELPRSGRRPKRKAAEGAGEGEKLV